MRAVLAALLLALGGCAAGPPAAPPVPDRAGVSRVEIPDGGLALRAVYARPEGAVMAPAVVALHGCGGPFPSRDNQWRDLLTSQGHPVLLPDSFGSRGLGSQCGQASRGVTPAGARRTDAVAAATWLAAQPGTPAGGLVVMGWSNGASTVLEAAADGVMPPGMVRGYVAFYPGCQGVVRRPGWRPGGKILIVMGEADDWTPAAPCRELAARFPGEITMVMYPGAYHDFDAPHYPVRTRAGLAYTAGHNGVAHVGTNEAGREAALAMVPQWIGALPAVR